MTVAAEDRKKTRGKQVGSWVKVIKARKNSHSYIAGGSATSAADTISGSGKPWREVMREALEQEESLYSQAIWKGSFRTKAAEYGQFSSEDCVDVHWFITRSEVIILHSHTSGRNVKYHVPHTDILNMFYSPSHSNKSTGTVDENADDGTLVLTFKDSCGNAVQLALIPRFGDESDFSRLKSLWYAAHVTASIFDADEHQILWSGQSVDTTFGDVLAWLVTKSQVMFCTTRTPIATHIPMYHIIDLVYHLGENSLDVKYAALRSTDNMSILSATDNCDIVERVITLPHFGIERDFDELGMLWRQGVQIRIIEDAFTDDETMESHLARYVAKLADPVAILQSIPEPVPTAPSRTVYKCKYNDDLQRGIKRADSMRRLFTGLVDTLASIRAEKQSNGFPDFLNTLEEALEELEEEQLSQLQEQTNEAKQDEVVPEPPLMTATPPSTPELLRRRSASFHDAIASHNPAHELPSAEPRPRRNTTTSLARGTEMLPANLPLIDNMYVAMYPYSNAGPAEMRFKAHDVMRIMKKDQTGWWYALRMLYECPSSDILADGRWSIVDEGWVPSNFLKALSHDS